MAGIQSLQYAWFNVAIGKKNNVVSYFADCEWQGFAKFQNFEVFTKYVSLKHNNYVKIFLLVCSVLIMQYVYHVMSKYV